MVNGIATVSMAMCYGAAASMITRIEVEADCSEPSRVNEDFPGPHYGIDISGYALLMLGIALMVQNIRSTWLLVDMIWLRRDVFHAWGLDPVVNSVLMIKSGPYGQDSPGLHEDNPKRSLYKQVRRTRVLVRIVWVVVAMVLVAVGVAAYFAKKESGFDHANIKENGGGNWQFWGFAYKFFGRGYRTSNWAGKSPCISC